VMTPYRQAPIARGTCFRQTCALCRGQGCDWCEGQGFILGNGSALTTGGRAFVDPRSLIPVPFAASPKRQPRKSEERRRRSGARLPTLA